MINLYLQYLNDINNELIRNGIRLPVNLRCDKEHIISQIDILEKYLYFNKVLGVCDSSYKIPSLICESEVSYLDWLKSQIKSEYEEVWKTEIARLTSQPEDAGKITGKVRPLDLEALSSSAYSDNSDSTVSESVEDSHTETFDDSNSYEEEDIDNDYADEFEESSGVIGDSGDEYNSYVSSKGYNGLGYGSSYSGESVLESVGMDTGYVNSNEMEEESYEEEEDYSDPYSYEELEADEDDEEDIDSYDYSDNEDEDESEEDPYSCEESDDEDEEDDDPYSYDEPEDDEDYDYPYGEDDSEEEYEYDSYSSDSEEDDEDYDDPYSNSEDDDEDDSYDSYGNEEDDDEFDDPYGEEDLEEEEDPYSNEEDDEFDDLYDEDDSDAYNNDEEDEYSDPYGESDDEDDEYSDPYGDDDEDEYSFDIDSSDDFNTSTNIQDSGINSQPNGNTNDVQIPQRGSEDVLADFLVKSVNTALSLGRKRYQDHRCTQSTDNRSHKG